jgi:hypothetical protein
MLSSLAARAAFARSVTGWRIVIRRRFDRIEVDLFGQEMGPKRLYQTSFCDRRIRPIRLMAAPAPVGTLDAIHHRILSACP